MEQDIRQQDAITIIHAYHERSKHRLDAYAAGPDFLDWADQPDPFRSFRGSERLTLPLAPEQPDTPYAQLFAGRGIAPSPLDLPHLALLLEVSLGLSAWKSHADQRWSLRCNPSSGNLQPTEAYLICPDLAGLAAGVHHYHCLDHALERRLIPGPSWGLAGPGQGVLLGLSSIHWREAWKYGERAYRYCQHDVGHALGAIRLAAASLGWETVLLDDWGDDAVAHLLGTDRAHDFPEEEGEAPGALLWIGPTQYHRPAAPSLLQAVDTGRWVGQASRLSPEHLHWAVIGEADAAARKGPGSRGPAAPLAPLPPLPSAHSALSAGRIFRQRRSAQRFDARAPALPGTDFHRILDALLPRPGVPPFDLLPWAPAIHPLLFVHRVEGLDPGCYLLPRHPGSEDRLRGALHADFLWQSVAGVPPHIPLRLLWRGDARDFARTLCCHQAIASQSLFTVAMLAEFAPRLEKGAWWYRWLHWEAGLLGQSLYLEAEAAMLRGTGIGCFFDDELHGWLGLGDRQFQSLYHFTVGRAVDDPRLTLLPPYAR